jgi:hypothetical protein
MRSMTARVRGTARKPTQCANPDSPDIHCSVRGENSGWARSYRKLSSAMITTLCRRRTLGSGAVPGDDALPARSLAAWVVPMSGYPRWCLEDALALPPALGSSDGVDSATGMDSEAPAAVACHTTTSQHRALHAMSFRTNHSDNESSCANSYHMHLYAECERV